MAGFPKFPMPKHSNHEFWIVNKKWLGNSISLVAGSILFWLSFVRYSASRMRTNEGVGNYIDPSHELAPKVINL